VLICRKDRGIEAGAKSSIGSEHSTMRLSHPPLLFPVAFPLVSLRDTKYPTVFSASTTNIGILVT